MDVKRRGVWRWLGSGLLWVFALSACTTQRATSVEQRGDPARVDAGVVESLQRQLREQEKRIAELESQLDALKVIDQDIGRRRRLPDHPRC